jgi:tetratricopeptide (TPR) repeat protein
MQRLTSTDSGIDGMRRALYHHRAGEFEQALIAYRALLTQDELNAPAHNNLGMLYQEKNLLDEAGREFQRAVLIDPGYALAHNNNGVTLLRRGQAAAAATAFQTAIALDPRNADAIVNLALAQAAAGQGAQARATLVRALGMSPRHAAAHYNLAVMYDEAGESARAVEHYAIFFDTAEPGQAGYVPQVRTRIEALSKR